MKIRSIVFQVAVDTIFSLRILHLQVRMIAMLLRKRLGNFLVAVETVEGGGPGCKLMAARALRRAGQRLVRFRQRTGGNLGLQRAARDHQICADQKHASMRL